MPGKIVYCYCCDEPYCFECNPGTICLECSRPRCPDCREKGLSCHSEDEVSPDVG